jgi:hypothetical protein
LWAGKGIVGGSEGKQRKTSRKKRVVRRSLCSVLGYREWKRVHDPIRELRWKKKGQESDLGKSIRQEDGGSIPARILYNMFKVEGAREAHDTPRRGKALQRHSFWIS